jgi:preprotein translocase subunit YajC
MFNPAYAQNAGSIAGFDFMSMLPLVLIFVVFYFFLIRPQQKKAQQQKDMLSSLRRGDRIITSGGLIGIITKVVNDQELQVEIAENIRVRVARSMVADLLSKTEPTPEVTAVETPPAKKAPAMKKPVAKKVAVKKPAVNKNKKG